VNERSRQIQDLHAELFPEAEPKPASRSFTTGPAAFLTDAEILDLCRRAANSAKFDALYRGSADAYQGDESAADAALCSLLAFYTQDAGQIDRIFSGSALCRDKWRERADYRQRTISLALSGLRETYSPPGIEYHIGYQQAHSRDSGANTGSSSRAETEAVPEAWEEPIAFNAQDLPPFPLIALPSVLGDYVAETAASTQVPPDMPALIALAVVAAAGSRTCLVQIGETHAEPLNLYVACIMEPGSRKSATLDALAAPLREAEREMIAASAGEVAVAQEKRGVEDKRLSYLRDMAAKAKDPVEREALMSDLADLALSLTEVPPLPRLLADDVTPERLASLMADQRGAMALLSAEGGIFSILAGRYSDGKANLDLFLKGHAGEEVRVDRQGRPSVHIPRACLTMGLTVQPDVLTSLADTPAFRGRGLLGRFLYALPDNLVGTRLYQNRRPDAAVRRRYEGMVHSLLALPAASDEDPGLRHVLRLEGSALDVWAQYADDTERRQSDGGDLAGIRDWGSKLAGAVARIAGGLHLVEQSGRPCPWTAPIAPETVAAAWAVGEYLTHHALAAFGQMGADPHQALARRLLRWVKRTNTTVFKLSECQQAHRNLSSMDDIAPALSVLCHRGYLRQQEADRRDGAGRPKSPLYLVNPLL